MVLDCGYWKWVGAAALQWAAPTPATRDALGGWGGRRGQEVHIAMVFSLYQGFEFGWNPLLFSLKQATATCFIHGSGTFFQKCSKKYFQTPNERLLTLKTSVGDTWHFGADPDPTLDTTTFFSDFKDAKKIFFSYYFSFNLPAGSLSSVLKFYFFAKVLC